MKDAHFHAKAPMYRTATATIACAHFKAGDIVGVQFHRVDEKGCAWFEVTKGDNKTWYPEHHLTHFVL